MAFWADYVEVPSKCRLFDETDIRFITKQLFKTKKQCLSIEGRPL